MGKASRRRGKWRKIDADALVAPSQSFSVEDEKARIQRLRDSQLWSQDSAPRKKRLMTKAARKRAAKRKLLSRGFSIKSKPMDHPKGSSATSKQVRIDKAAQEAIIKFSNGTKKAIKLEAHCDVKANQTRLRKRVDYNKNNRDHRFKFMRGNGKLQPAPKDLWLDEDDDGEEADKQRGDAANAASANETCEDGDDVDCLPDVNAGKLLTAQKRAYAGHMSSRRVVHNGLIGSCSFLSLPNSGESINPLQHQYYFLKWKASQLRIRHFFVRQYQTRGTHKLCQQYIGVESGIEKQLKEMQTETDEWKRLYVRHLGKYKLRQQKLVWLHRGKKSTSSESDAIERQISQSERSNTFRSDVRNIRLRRKAVRTKQKLASHSNMYGQRRRYKPRVTPSMPASALGDSLRRTMASNVDHPLSFMFNEMQKQNRIVGSKTKKYVIGKRSFHGPRFRVQTRIGKLHHANVDQKLYDGLDDMETI